MTWLCNEQRDDSGACDLLGSVLTVYLNYHHMKTDVYECLGSHMNNYCRDYLLI